MSKGVSGAVFRLIIMKTSILCLGFGALLSTTYAFAGILAGPITNPANGHDYFLLSPNSWTVSEAEAERLGGTLAIIKNAGDQEWVFSTFGNYGGARRQLWIGLHRKTPGGPFTWVDGTPVNYTDWGANEPNNEGGREDWAQMRWESPEPGMWNDSIDSSQFSGVVEVVKNPKGLKALHALVGQWFEEGNAQKPCYVAASGDAVFAINDSNHFSGRLVSYRDGILFVAAWQVHGELIKDKILWSNGTWWSRKPVEYDAADSIKPEELKKAAGKQYDTPLLQ